MEEGETLMEALAREIEEETGWRLRRVVAPTADWEWEHAGVVRRKIDYLCRAELRGKRAAGASE
ncbi:MAG: NUDIX domain-containing protein [Limnochordales bacterium]